jgi:transcription antitermination factor NusG
MTWRLLYVRPQSETRYHASLAERGLSCFVPKETIWRGIGVRRQPADKPLLPGYVFADLTDAQLAEAAHLPDVLYIIRSGDRPATIPDGFINRLMESERRGEFDRTRKERQRAKRYGKPLKPGERFEVLSGMWAGHVGEIARAMGGKRAEIILSLFGDVHPVVMEFSNMRAVDDEREGAAA